MKGMKSNPPNCFKLVEFNFEESSVCCELKELNLSLTLNSGFEDSFIFLNVVLNLSLTLNSRFEDSFIFLNFTSEITFPFKSFRITEFPLILLSLIILPEKSLRIR